MNEILNKINEKIIQNMLKLLLNIGLIMTTQVIQSFIYTGKTISIQKFRTISMNTIQKSTNKFNTNINPIIIKKTGSFISQLPEVYPGPVHYKRAVRKIREIKIDDSIKNLRNANRKLGAEVLDNLMKYLTIPITNTLKVYKTQLKKLHPFESTVVDLTIVSRIKAGNPDLQDVLQNLLVLRAGTSKIGKEYASRAKNATSAMEARDLMVEGMKTLENYYTNAPEAIALSQLSDIQKDLRRIPIIELDVPTVVLVGSPNVGKSSIVRAVSSGTPEVNDYPFTTRGVTIGHIVDIEKGLRFQVMDTPGLLDRPSEERNEMEKLTFASMAHLPTAVLYVIDPSGLSGDKSTFQAQLNVRNYLKSRFPMRPWLDVVSKADIELSDDIIEKLPIGYLQGINNF